MSAKLMFILTDGHSVVVPICAIVKDQIIRTGWWLMINNCARAPHLVAETDVKYLTRQAGLQAQTMKITPDYMSRLDSYLTGNGFSLIDMISRVYAKFN